MQNFAKKRKDLVPPELANLSEPPILSEVGPPNLALRAPNLNIVPTPAPILDTAVDFNPKSRSRRVYLALGKRLLDLVVLAITLPITLPVIGIFALALWIESGNPFYMQERLGRSGRVFRLLKLRTMYRGADKMLEDILANDAAMRIEWHFTQKLKNDPRITKVGRLLRATSMDELPQIWNVLIGEMSLIGPRPMMPDQLEMYGNPKSYNAMRPGLTGLWQIRERNDSHFSFRAEADRSYFNRVSIWLDMWILFKTVGAVLRRTGY